MELCNDQTDSETLPVNVDSFGQAENNIRIYLHCQREKGHWGDHACLSLRGFITWHNFEDWNDDG